MSRLRMMSGMAAAIADTAKGPVATACGFIITAIKGLGAVARVVLPVLFFSVMILLLVYIAYTNVQSHVAQAKVMAEMTRHETAFNESLQAAAKSADNLRINSRIRAVVGSRLGESDMSTLGSESGHWPSSLEGVPNELMEYRSLTVLIVSPQNDTEHTVRLTVMQSTDTRREYISVELSGEQAYLCVAEYRNSTKRVPGFVYSSIVTSKVLTDLQPWVYKGIGQWEHLLDMTENLVNKDRQQQEINSRFGNLEDRR